MGGITQLLVLLNTLLSMQSYEDYGIRAVSYTHLTLPTNREV